MVLVAFHALLSLLWDTWDTVGQYVPQFLWLFIAIFLILWDCGTFSHIASCVRDFYTHIHIWHITHIFPYSVYIGFLSHSPTVPILRALRCVQPSHSCPTVPHVYKSLTNPSTVSSSFSVISNLMHSVNTPLSRFPFVIFLPLVSINPFDFNQEVIDL